MGQECRRSVSVSSSKQLLILYESDDDHDSVYYDLNEGFSKDSVFKKLSFLAFRFLLQLNLFYWLISMQVFILSFWTI